MTSGGWSHRSIKMDGPGRSAVRSGAKTTASSSGFERASPQGTIYMLLSSGEFSDASRAIGVFRVPSMFRGRMFEDRTIGAVSGTEVICWILSNSQMCWWSCVHLFPTNFGQSACNSVKVQPISTLRLPNHARPAAELPNRRNCLHYFRNACTVA